MIAILIGVGGFLALFFGAFLLMAKYEGDESVKGKVLETIGSILLAILILLIIIL